ncbi:MAG: YmaF family protein [Bacilli bacterium]|jgi:hypothetical protein
MNPRQTHTHEFTGNTMLAGRHLHSHRMAGISSEVIPVPGGHVHELISYTSFDDNHFHTVKVRTSLPIPVAPNMHVHFVRGHTSFDDGHNHGFEFSTLV